MHSSSKSLLHVFVVSTLALSGIGCGYTGPDEQNGGGGNTPPPTGTNPGNGTIDPTTYSLTTDKLEFVEGSGPDASKTFPLTFQFNKPLEADAVVKLDLQASTFPQGIFEGKLSPSPEINLNKGATGFSITLESYTDTTPEPEHLASWRPTLSIAGKSAVLSANNGVKIIDDDQMTGNLTGDPMERNNIVRSGDVVEWDLNGSLIPFQNETFTITQISGVETKFAVTKDKFRALIPAPNKFDSNSIHEARSGEITFRVSASNGANYDIGWVLMRSSSFSPLSWQMKENESDDASPSKSTWYLSDIQLNTDGLHHLVTPSYSGPQYQVSFAGPQYRIKEVEGASVTKLHNSHEIPQLDSALTEMVISNDGKQISFKPGSWQTIVAQIPEKDGIKLEFGLTIEQLDDQGNPIVVAPDEPLMIQSFEIQSALRVADKAVTVTLSDIIPESVINEGKLTLVVRDSYTDHPGDGLTIELPLNTRTLTLPNLYAGVFDVYVVDLEGNFSGSANLTLYPEDSSKSIVIEGRSNTASAVNNDSFLTMLKGSAGCSLEGVQQVISSAEKDTQKSCSYTFTLSDLNSTPNKKDQLVIKATSNEWPSFSTSKSSPYDDKWSAKLTSNLDIGLTLNETTTVNKSHISSKDVYFVSKCFQYGIPYDPKFTVDMSATNIADDQLHTKVSAYIRPCEPALSVNFVAKAFGSISSGKREFRFIHAKSSVASDDNRRMYLSVPKDVPNSITATNNQRKFDAYIDLKPLNPEVKPADITIKKIDLALHEAKNGSTKVASIESISIPSTPTSKAVVSDEPSAQANKTFKRISLNEYLLPQTPTTPATGYNVYDAPIMVSATVTYSINGTEYTSEPSMMNVSIPSLAVDKAVQFFPLYELRSVATGTNSVAISNTRWNTWSGNSTAATGGGRYGGRDDTDAGDGWISPTLWKNLFANALTIPVCNAGDTAAHCDTNISDNQDYLDELRIGDTSAFNVRCTATIASNSGNSNETWSKCKSIIKHSTHHHGRSLDIRYVMPDGTVRDDNYSGQGGNRFYARWCEYYAPATTAATKTEIRKELRNFALRNRNFIEWIKQNMANTSTPFQRVFVGNNQKYVNNSAAANYTCSHANNGMPTLRTFLKNGVLPGNSVDNGTPNDTSDDNVGSWSIPDAELKQEIEHDHHIHIDFSFNPAAVSH